MNPTVVAHKIIKIILYSLFLTMKVVIWYCLNKNIHYDAFMKKFDVIIIGAGAAGLMCAIEAGKRGRDVLVLDHANKVGKKILMSGGGRCNFTNYHISYDKYISRNPHFFKSALSRYTQWDFIELVKKHNIPFHEKTLGQLFCDDKAKAIVNLLLAECKQAQAHIKISTAIKAVKKIDDNVFSIKTNHDEYQCESLVIATGGLSIPTMGATPLGYKIAEQFGLNVWPTRAGLVPFTLHEHDKEKLADLSGVSVDAIVSNKKISFQDKLLFTHRGLSGPAVLQISSYWQPGEAINVNLLPNDNLLERLKQTQLSRPQLTLRNFLANYLPKRLVDVLIDPIVLNKPLQNISYQYFVQITAVIQQWTIKPNATEGYRTAEVTLGGVDCAALSSKTMQANNVVGLYFIGEVIDVTGWLGGYNFQWAWSSGWAAGQVV